MTRGSKVQTRTAPTRTMLLQRRGLLCCGRRAQDQRGRRRKARGPEAGVPVRRRPGGGHGGAGGRVRRGEPEPPPVDGRRGADPGDLHLIDLHRTVDGKLAE